MRFLLGLTFALTTMAHAAEGRATPKLLSYDEVMRLTTEKRTEYFHNLGLLLAMMEEKFELGSEVVAQNDARELRDQIQRMMQIMDVLPEADAEPTTPPRRQRPPATTPAALTTPPASAMHTAGTDPIGSIVPQWAPNDPNKFTCGNPDVARFDESVGTCVLWKRYTDGSGSNVIPVEEACPPHSRSVRRPRQYLNTSPRCIPDASWNLLPQKEKDRFGSYLFDTYNKPEDFAALSDDEKKKRVGISGNAAGQTRPVTEGGAKKPGDCEYEPRKCEPMDKDTRKKLTAEFRVKDAKVCIAGGFFQPKTGKSADKYSCHVVSKWPNPPVGKFQFKCGTNEGLCNPALFCLTGQTKSKAGKVVELPIGNCQPVGVNFTSRCAQTHQDFISQKKKVPGLSANEKPKECDPSNLKVPLKEAYAKLIKETEEMFSQHCADGSPLLPLFCEECRVVGEQLQRIAVIAGVSCPQRGNNGTSPTPAAAPEGQNPATHQ